jgi:transposase-like protein
VIAYPFEELIAMTTPLSLGPTNQSKAEFCPSCDSREIVKRGIRRNSHRHLQIYWCKDCKYFLALRGLKRLKYPPRLIARALGSLNLGHSQEEVAQQLASEHRITVPRLDNLRFDGKSSQEDSQ